MYRKDFWTLWEKARVGCFKRTASKHVYYLGWNRSPAQVGCMRQALGPGALGRPRGTGWRGRWEGGSGWGTHVNPWLIHFNVWQNPLQLKKKEKRICLQCRRPRFNPWVRKIPWRREWQTTLVFFPGKSHGQRSLEGYSPRGHKESDTTERPTHMHTKYLQEYLTITGTE